MAALKLELPPELYARLRAEAERLGRSIQDLAQDWLAEHLAEAPSTTPAASGEPPPAPMSDRDRTTEVLRAAGLLAEPSPEMRRLAAESTMTLEEVSAALDRAGGKPLSELILEMRGPKE